jgi:hypothetical protein
MSASANALLLALVEELLEAQLDTVELALEDSDTNVRWRGHVQYLQGLRRHGETLLARLPDVQRL